MRGQLTAEQGRAAQAKDAASKFNVMNRQSVAQQNLAARQAQENQRAAIGRQQETHNKGLIAQQFGQQLTGQ